MKEKYLKKLIYFLHECYSKDENIAVMPTLMEKQASAVTLKNLLVLLENNKELCELYLVVRLLDVNSRAYVISKSNIAFPEGMTLELIAIFLGITKERVRQIENMAMRKIKLLLLEK